MHISLLSDQNIIERFVLDQRREVRANCNGSIQVMTLGSRQQTFAGTLHDISPSGLCIYVKRRLTKGTLVAIITNEIIFGRVRYSILVPEGRKTGIQIDNRLGVRRLLNPGDSQATLL